MSARHVNANANGVVKIQRAYIGNRPPMVWLGWLIWWLYLDIDLRSDPRTAALYSHSHLSRVRQVNITPFATAIRRRCASFVPVRKHLYMLMPKRASFNTYRRVIELCGVVFRLDGATGPCVMCMRMR